MAPLATGQAAGLRGAWSQVEGHGALLTRALLVAGIPAGTVPLLQGLFTQVLADHVAALGDGGAIRALYDLNTEGATYKLLALGVFLVLAGLLIFRTSTFPRWLVWRAVVLGPLLAVAGWNFVWSANVRYAAYAALLILLLIWVAAVSLVSWRRAV